MALPQAMTTPRSINEAANREAEREVYSLDVSNMIKTLPGYASQMRQKVELRGNWREAGSMFASSRHPLDHPSKLAAKPEVKMARPTNSHRICSKKLCSVVDRNPERVWSMFDSNFKVATAEEASRRKLEAVKWLRDAVLIEGRRRKPYRRLARVDRENFGHNFESRTIAADMSFFDELFGEAQTRGAFVASLHVEWGAEYYYTHCRLYVGPNLNERLSRGLFNFIFSQSSGFSLEASKRFCLIEHPLWPAETAESVESLVKSAKRLKRGGANPLMIMGDNATEGDELAISEARQKKTRFDPRSLPQWMIKPPRLSGLP